MATLLSPWPSLTPPWGPVGVCGDKLDRQWTSKLPTPPPLRWWGLSFVAFVYLEKSYYLKVFCSFRLHLTWSWATVLPAPLEDWSAGFSCT